MTTSPSLPTDVFAELNPAAESQVSLGNGSLGNRLYTLTPGVGVHRPIHALTTYIEHTDSQTGACTETEELLDVGVLTPTTYDFDTVTLQLHNRLRHLGNHDWESADIMYLINEFESFIGLYAPYETRSLTTDEDYDEWFDYDDEDGICFMTGMDFVAMDFAGKLTHHDNFTRSELCEFIFHAASAHDAMGATSGRDGTFHAYFQPTVCEPFDEAFHYTAIDHYYCNPSDPSLLEAHIIAASDYLDTTSRYDIKMFLFESENVDITPSFRSAARKGPVA